ncbi:MAG: hypothetical protein KAY37_12250 [Phycisphaerae bacterium]|nr:hypothetical protein [Phycisphaerae bacterium]
MSDQKHEPLPDAPFGTSPRRPAWPLITLIIIFLLWVTILIWLAVKYPAR